MATTLATDNDALHVQYLSFPKEEDPKVGVDLVQELVLFPRCRETFNINDSSWQFFTLLYWVCLSYTMTLKLFLVTEQQIMNYYVQL